MYKILFLENGKMICSFSKQCDEEAIKVFDVYVQKICKTHGEELRGEYILKQAFDEFIERTVKS